MIRGGPRLTLGASAVNFFFFPSYIKISGSAPPHDSNVNILIGKKRILQFSGPCHCLLKPKLIKSWPNFDAGAQSIGVCYGRNGNNLPPDGEVVALYKSSGIGRMRIYEPYPSTLDALRGSNIELIIGILNSDLQGLTDAAAATTWVQNNIRNYWPDVKFKYIAVGNKVHPGEDAAQYVQPAMQNILNAIAAANLQDQIKVLMLKLFLFPSI
jgi:hypothetical protein